MTVEVIDLEPTPTELVDVTPLAVQLQDVVVGPPGPRGPSGSAGSAWLHVQAAPLATWTIAHPFGRLPSVTVYDSQGELVEPDVYSTPTGVSVVFPLPYTGTAVLT